MDEYPDPDDEFDLMHEDEMENMMMMEDDLEEEPLNFDPPPKSRRTLDFASPPAAINNAPISTPVAPHTSASLQSVEETRCPNKLPDMDTRMERAAAQVDLSKRKFDELFGDITDIGFDDDDLDVPSKRPKPDSDEQLIKRILEERKYNEVQMKATRFAGTTRSTNSSEDTNKNNISSHVPRWPFIPVTSENGDRLYVRLRSEEYFDREVENNSVKGKTTGLLAVPYNVVRQQAELIMQKMWDKVDKLATEPDVMIVSDGKEEKNDAQLWVEKYKPKTYLELLSDESTNRTLLHWLKLWDKAVFNREKKVRNKPKPVKVDEKSFGKAPNNRFTKKFGADMKDDLDVNGCPQFKMALLCGPPGLGKTTLAHMIAVHAGYNVVEVNASDERSPDAFRTALQAATQMRAVLGEKKPNCLVLDEIDGAPAASIEVLVKFVTGKDVGKGRGKKKGMSGILKRPIICICNDVYVPALRPLRQLAFVVHFPPTVCTRLAQRLLEISRKQHIKTDLGVLLALAEKSQNDIRSCVSVLHFFKAKNKDKAEVRLSDVLNSKIGQKDVQKGLFTVWQEIFQIQRSKNRRVAGNDEKLEPMPDLEANNAKLGDMNLTTRMHKLLRTVQGCGDYDKLTQGVFENYPHMNIRDSTLEGVVNSMEWMCTSDILNRSIYGEQNYCLMAYLPYAFVAYHFNFSSLAWPKLSYPSAGYENSVKDARTKQLIKDLLRGMSPKVRAYTSSSQLLLDTLPILLDILVPNLRPVSTQLYSSREKAELHQVISIMIDFNINYVQERTVEGSYVYNLDPNIEELCVFKREDNEPQRALSYSGKQLLSQEIEVEKMRRAEASRHSIVEAAPAKPPTAGETQPAVLPSHLQCLVPKPIPKIADASMMKDFFGRLVPCSQITGSSTITDEIVKSDIWFHFKEGFSNAVRRAVRIQDLL